MSDLAAGHAARISDVQQWHADFVAANTAIASGELRSAIHDIALADAVRVILLQCLRRLYNDGTLAWTAWAASTAVSRYEVREPTTANGYKYRAQGAGTTAASEPTWPTTIGNTVVDGGVTWECVSKKPEERFDDLLTTIDTDLAALEAIETDFADFEAVPVIQTSTAYTRGDLVRSAYNTSGEPGSLATVWVCIDGGTTDASFSSITVPSSSTRFGDVNANGTAQFKCLGELPFWSDKQINQDGETSSMSATVDDFVRRYSAPADRILAAAEIEPDFNQASTTGKRPGGACWQDSGDDYWWVPEGTALLPAFTNKEYVSAQAAADGGAPIPTHEFGMVIKVECTTDIKEGDSVTVQIGDAGWPATYQVGDELHLATIAAAPLYLGGGVTGTDTFTWQVARSVSGAGTDYSQDLATPALYDDGQVKFRINDGGIAHALGDAFVFCVEDTTFKWRQDGGGWSADLDIQQTALADGLKAEFTEGACPSFVTGDSASFTALQPYAVGQAATPDDQSFAWTGTGTVITASVTGTVDAIMLARHTLPSGCTVNVQDGASLNENIPWAEGPMVLLLSSALTNPSLTITITNATDASIGWLWAGEILSTDEDPSHARRRVYQMNRGAGVNPSAGLQGRGIGYSVDFLCPTDTDFAKLVTLLEDVKADADAPLCLVVGEADAAELVRAPDAIDYDDHMRWAEGAANRAIVVNVEFAPWLTSP